MLFKMFAFAIGVLWNVIMQQEFGFVSGTLKKIRNMN